MTKKNTRIAQTAMAFLFSFAAAGLVWQSGHRSGLEEAATPSPSPIPSPAPNAFTDPAAVSMETSDFARQINRLVAQSEKTSTPEQARQQAQALYDLAHAAHFQNKGGGTLSLTAYEEARRLVGLAGDKLLEADILLDLSGTQRLLGRTEDAETSLRSALALREAGFGAPSQRADTLYRLGDFLQARGRYQEAHTFLDRALRLQQRLANEPGMADCLRTMGQAAYEENSLALSRQLLNDAARLFAKNEKIESRAAVLGQLGDVALKEGDINEAKQFYTEGLHVWQERKQGFWTGRFLVRLGTVALKENDLTKAKSLATEGRQLLAASNGPIAQAKPLLLLGEIARREGNKNDAKQFILQAKTIYQTTGNASGIAECQNALNILNNS
jgi:tetratricopeptide (TPR) repeat protein